VTILVYDFISRWSCLCLRNDSSVKLRTTSFKVVLAPFSPFVLACLLSPFSKTSFSLLNDNHFSTRQSEQRCQPVVQEIQFKSHFAPIVVVVLLLLLLLVAATDKSTKLTQQWFLSIAMLFTK